MRYSYSRLHTFDECEYKFYLKYVLELGEYRPHVSSVFGKAVHETIDFYYKTEQVYELHELKIRLRSYITTGVIGRDGVEEHGLGNEIVTQLDNFSNLFKTTTEQCAKEAGVEVASVPSTKIWQTVYKPGMEAAREDVEKSVRFLMGRNKGTKAIRLNKKGLLSHYMDAFKCLENFYKYASDYAGEVRPELELNVKVVHPLDKTKTLDIIGFIDRVEAMDGRVRIVDYKTGVTKYTQQMIENTMQLPLYALMYEDLNPGVKVDTVAYWALLKDEWVEAPFDREGTRAHLVQALNDIEMKLMDMRTAPNIISYEIPNRAEYLRVCGICEFRDTCKYIQGPDAVGAGTQAMLDSVVPKEGVDTK